MGKNWNQGQNLFSWAPKSLQMVTAVMKLKDHIPWEKSYHKPREHLKSRDTTLQTKGPTVKATVFPVVKYGYDSWIIKKAEHRRTDAFELWC